jgi:hypothetical protein
MGLLSRVVDAACAIHLGEVRLVRVVQGPRQLAFLGDGIDAKGPLRHDALDVGRVVVDDPNTGAGDDPPGGM